MEKREIPGDNQSPQLVESWVQKHVTTGTVMVVRTPMDAGLLFRLVEVDLIATAEKYLYAAGHGSFALTGYRAVLDPIFTRLLIPMPDVVQWAIGLDICVNGSPVRFRRDRDPRCELLYKKLLEQARTRST